MGNSRLVIHQWTCHHTAHPSQDTLKGEGHTCSHGHAHGKPSQAADGSEAKHESHNGSVPSNSIPEEACQICSDLGQAPARVEPTIDIAFWVALNVQIPAPIYSSYVPAAIGPTSLRGPPAA